MNGSNGSTNGSGPKTFQNPYESIKWQVGLVNESGKFLTAETFGFKLNVSATSLKQRQMWTVVPDSKADGVQLKSHLNRYLCADKDGVVTCEEEALTPECCFLVEYCPKGSGGWAFKSQEHNLYFTGSGDRVSCFSKTPAWWTIRLAVHPQVHLRNLNRQRYLRLEDDEIHGNQTLPWGYDSLITLEHKEGRVAVRTRDKRYLDRTGQLLEEGGSEDTLYNLEMHGGPLQGLAFRDREGKYLTLIGSTGTMKSKNKTVGKDEIFIMEDSYAQVGLCAFNGKYASIKQGVDLYANQSDLEEKETFQLEFQPACSKWRLRTCEGKLWTISKDKAGIKGSGSDQDPNTLFEMEYHESGSVALKAANDQYVNSKKLGLVSASGEAVGEEERFRLVLVNRPIMVFRCDYGYLGTRSGRVECNFVNYEAFTLEHSSKATGHYILRVNNGDYWELADNGGVNLSKGAEPALFILQFHTRTHLAILAPNGKFLRGEQNGQIRADADEVAGATLWEY